MTEMSKGTCTGGAMLHWLAWDVFSKIMQSAEDGEQDAEMQK